MSEPDRFMRHKNYEFWLDPNTDSSDLYLKDSSLTVRKGLDGSAGSISFESVNYPGYYLRHAGYTCQLNKPDGTDLFNEDASFYQLFTPYGISVRLLSVNYPDHMLTHDDNQRVRISKFDSI
jgi:hypothetical protein